MRSLLRPGAVVAAGALLALGGQQASAQPQRPGDVGMVTIVQASKTSMTISWPQASGAADYLIERGRDLTMVNRAVVSRTQGNKMTVTGLRPGSLYCFQVRGVNAAGVGPRSYRGCQRTVAREGSSHGPVYRVVTYNICSRACPGWNQRRPDAAALVAARRPDVVMLEEATDDSGMAGAIGGMTQVVHDSGKALLYRTDAFTVATHGGSRRTGSFELGSGHYAVWAELVDRESQQHVIFESAHFAPGPDTAASDALRKENASRLVAGTARINPEHLPVVIGGDFNSYEQRRFDGGGDVLRASGLADSFWRAHRWFQGNYNTVNHSSPVPDIGFTWGRHIDQVWAEPGRTQVLKWRNGANVENGRYVPLPSNHAPVLVRLRVNS